MKKLLITTVFFALLEYQEFSGGGEYSLITGAGLLLLLIYLAWSGDGLISFRKGKAVPQQPMNWQQKLIAVLYTGVLLVQIMLNLGQEGAFISFAIFATVGLTLAIIIETNYQNLFQKDHKIAEGPVSIMHNFTQQILHLFLVTFLISVQIHQSAAFQSLLLVSALILYDILNGQEKVDAQIKQGTMSPQAVSHFFFHRWCKYWNYFLQTWYILIMQSNNLITESQTFIVLLCFMVAYFTIQFRNLRSFSLKDFVLISFLATALSGLNPLLQNLTGISLPSYVIAAMLFIFFDLGEVYFHQHEFQETSIKFWSQKATMFLLVTVYVFQIHVLMTDEIAGFKNISAMVMSFTGNANQSVQTSVLGAQTSTGKVDVADTENQTHRRGSSQQ